MPPKLRSIVTGVRAALSASVSLGFRDEGEFSFQSGSSPTSKFRSRFRSRVGSTASSGVNPNHPHIARHRRRRLWRVAIKAVRAMVRLQHLLPLVITLSPQENRALEKAWLAAIEAGGQEDEPVEAVPAAKSKGHGKKGTTTSSAPQPTSSSHNGATAVPTVAMLRSASGIAQFLRLTGLSGVDAAVVASVLENLKYPPGAVLRLEQLLFVARRCKAQFAHQRGLAINYVVQRQAGVGAESAKTASSVATPALPQDLASYVSAAMGGGTAGDDMVDDVGDAILHHFDREKGAEDGESNAGDDYPSPSSVSRTGASSGGGEVTDWMVAMYIQSFFVAAAADADAAMHQQHLEQLQKEAVPSSSSPSHRQRSVSRGRDKTGAGFDVDETPMFKSTGSPSASSLLPKPMAVDGFGSPAAGPLFDSVVGSPSAMARNVSALVPQMSAVSTAFGSITGGGGLGHLPSDTFDPLEISERSGGSPAMDPDAPRLRRSTLAGNVGGGGGGAGDSSPASTATGAPRRSRLDSLASQFSVATTASSGTEKGGGKRTRQQQSALEKAVALIRVQLNDVSELPEPSHPELGVSWRGFAAKAERSGGGGGGAVDPGAFAAQFAKTNKYIAQAFPMVTDIHGRPRPYTVAEVEKRLNELHDKEAIQHGGLGPTHEEELLSGLDPNSEEAGRARVQLAALKRRRAARRQAASRGVHFCMRAPPNAPDAAAHGSAAATSSSAQRPSSRASGSRPSSESRKPGAEQSSYGDMDRAAEDYGSMLRPATAETLSRLSQPLARHSAPLIAERRDMAARPASQRSSEQSLRHKAFKRVARVPVPAGYHRADVSVVQDTSGRRDISGIPATLSGGASSLLQYARAAALVPGVRSASAEPGRRAATPSASAAKNFASLALSASRAATPAAAAPPPIGHHHLPQHHSNESGAAAAAQAPQVYASVPQLRPSSQASMPPQVRLAL